MTQVGGFQLGPVALTDIITDKGGQVFNVKAYGAVGDGVTDDTVAIKAAFVAAAATGGTAYFPPTTGGTWIANLADSPAQSTSYLRIQGSGKYATIIKGTLAVDHVLGLNMPGEVCDLTVDGGAVATNALICTTTGAISISEMAVRRVRCRNQALLSAGWNLVIWDQAQIFQIDRVYLDDVTVEGPSATNTDAFSVSYVNICQVRNIDFRGLHRSPNFYSCNDLFIDGLFSDGCPATATFVIDYLVKRAVVNNVVVDATNANGTPIIIGTPYLQANNWNYALPANPTGGQIISSGAQVAGATWEFTNCKLNGIGWSVAMRLVSCVNCDLFASPTGQCFRDQSAGATVTTHVRVVGGTLDGTSFNFPLFNATNAVTWSKLTVVGVECLRTGATVIGANITNSSPLYGDNQGALTDQVVGGHIVSTATGTPATSNLGANVTSATFTGNDTRGTIAIVMAGGLAANTRVCTATFATTYGATAPKVSLIDQTSTAGLAIVNSYVMAGATGAAFDIAFDQALVAGTYTIDYIVIG